MKTLSLMRVLVGAWLVLPILVWAQDSAEEPEVIGVEMARPDGTFMGLAVEGNRFVLRFYDAEKKLIDPDVARAAVWWDPRNTAGRERAVLNPQGDGLVSPPKVRPPLVFRAMVTLLNEEGSSTGSYSFNLQDLDKPKPDAAAGGSSRY
ncbi:MAG: hypothetical protein SynsKO_38170 [Synoicihabitans sp.]